MLQKKFASIISESMNFQPTHKKYIIHRPMMRTQTEEILYANGVVRVTVNITLH